MTEERAAQAVAVGDVVTIRRLRCQVPDCAICGTVSAPVLYGEVVGFDRDSIGARLCLINVMGALEPLAVHFGAFQPTDPRWPARSSHRRCVAVNMAFNRVERARHFFSEN